MAEKGRLKDLVIISISFIFPGYVYAYQASYPASPLIDFLKLVASTIKDACLIVGWGLGFYYVVAGIRDLAYSDPNDIHMKRRGANKVSGGICLIGLGTLIKWIMEHFGFSLSI